MTGRQVRQWLGAVFLVGTLARIAAWRWDPPLHPDEYFQYLEPAWLRLQGVGIGSWEWRDGIRSWVLPGYHGAWLRVFTWLGLQLGGVGGAALQLHWALVSTTMIWAAWRGGKAVAASLESRARRNKSSPPRADQIVAQQNDAPPPGWQGGLLAATLCALFPLLVTFSVHTLSELPAMLAYVASLALVLELAHQPGTFQRASAAGVLLGLATGLRIANAPLALIPFVVLVSARRWRHLATMMAAGLLPVALFGLVDVFTWGGFASSYVHYLKFNFIQHGADQFGVFPTAFYVDRLVQRLPVALPVLGVLALAGVRVTWPLLLGAVGLVSYLSTQGHKEERFVMLFWPLLLIAAGAAAGSLLARLGARFRQGRRWAAGLGAVVLVLVLGDGARRFTGYDFQLLAGRMDAQAWTGRQSDVTGLLFDSPLYTGGYLWFGRALPQGTFTEGMLGNSLFSHVLAVKGSGEEEAAKKAGFVVVHETGGVVVLRRAAP